MTSLRTALALAGAGLALGAPAAGAQSTSPTPTGPVAEIVEGSALVRFEPGTDARAVERALDAVGVGLVDGLGFPDAYEVRFDEALDERAVARSLAAQPGVRWAEPDVYGEVLATPPALEVEPGDAGYAAQWPLHGPPGSIDAQRAWGITEGTSDAVVAVIDVGVNFDHPQLQGVWATNDDEIPGNAQDDDGNGYVDDWRGYDFGSKDSHAGDNLEWDSGRKGHGTSVAGVIAATADATGLRGVVRDANILPVKVANAKGRFTAGKLASGIAYAQNMGAEVANVSMTVGIWTNAIDDALDYADDVLVVAGSGNAGHDLDHFWESYPCESNELHVICVASNDEDGTLSAFSDHGNEVDLAAPGASQPGLSFDGEEQVAGTSIAAPQVAGAAALLWAMDPWIPDPSKRLSPQRARAALLGTVTKDPSMTYAIHTGGRLDAYAALRSLAVLPPVASALNPSEIHAGYAKLRIAVDHNGTNLTNVAVQFRPKGGSITHFWWPTPRSRASLDQAGGILSTSQVLPAKGHYEYRALAQNAYGATQWSPWVAFDNLPDPVDPDGPTEVVNPPKPTH